MAFEQNGINQMDESELKELLNDEKKEWTIIDVREPEEYEEAHIPGIPLIPMQTVPQMIEQLNKNKEYLFICKSGGRSQAVAEFMKEQGFAHVHNFAGGMLTWSGETKTGLEWVVKDGKELD